MATQHRSKKIKDRLKDVTATEDGLLTALYRKVMFETGKLNEVQGDIKTYILSGGNKVKGSILSSIIEGEMTWKTLLFLLFEISRFKKITLSITVEDENNTVTTHSIVSIPKPKERKRSERRTFRNNKHNKQ